MEKQREVNAVILIQHVKLSKDHGLGFPMLDRLASLAWLYLRWARIISSTSHSSRGPRDVSNVSFRLGAWWSLLVSFVSSVAKGVAEQSSADGTTPKSPILVGWNPLEHYEESEAFQCSLQRKSSLLLNSKAASTEWPTWSALPSSVALLRSTDVVEKVAANEAK